MMLLSRILEIIVLLMKKVHQNVLHIQAGIVSEIQLKYGSGVLIGI